MEKGKKTTTTMQHNALAMFCAISFYLRLRSKRCVLFSDSNGYYLALAACSARFACVLKGTKNRVCLLIYSEDWVMFISMTMNNQEAPKDKRSIINAKYEAESKKQDTGEILKAGKKNREAPKNKLMRIKLHGASENQQDIGKLFKDGNRNREALKKILETSSVWTTQPLPPEHEREITAYPVVVSLTNPPYLSGDNPMRSERRRYASYARCPRVDGWPSRLARDGFYFSEAQNQIQCFLCEHPPPQHNAPCQWQSFNVVFSVELAPVPEPRCDLQALGVTVRDGPPSLEDLHQRIATLLRHYPQQVAGLLGKAGFFAGLCTNPFYFGLNGFYVKRELNR